MDKEMKKEVLEEMELFLSDIMELRGISRKEALHMADGCPRFYWGMFYNILESHPGFTTWAEVAEEPLL